jgi:hypothetical protein
LGPGIYLQDISLRTGSQGCSYHLFIVVRGYEDYFCAGNELVYSIRSFYSSQVWQADV